MANNHPVLVFVDTARDAGITIKRYGGEIKSGDYIVMASTPAAQGVLAKQHLPYFSYINLIPDTPKVQAMVDRANYFAMNWYKNSPMENVLNYNDINIAFYLIGYWTNLLVIYQLSLYVLNTARHLYHPREIIYFSRNFPPELAINTDYFVLQTCGRKILGKKITLSAITPENMNTMNMPILGLLKRLFITLIETKNVGLITREIFMSLLIKTKVLPPELHRADILIYGDKHILVNAIPLIRSLQGRFSVQILGAVFSLDQRLRMAKAGLTPCLYEDLEKPTYPKSTVANIRKMWRKFSCSKKYAGILKKSGLSSLEPAITQSFNSYFDRQLHNIFVTLAQTEKIIKAVQPKATILFGNYGKKGLSLSYLTKKNGGKVFTLEHGIVPNPIQIHPPVYDKMLFWGNWSRRGFRRAFNEPQSKLGVVGSFITDHVSGEMAAARKRAYNRHDIPTKKLTILLLTTFPAYDFPKQMKMILDLIRYLDEIGIAELIIRPHPGEEMPSNLPIDYSLLKFKITWDSGKDLDTQIRKSDIVISEGTSVALRVMMWGKPLIHLVTENIVDYTNFSRHGAAVKLDDATKLPEEIKLLAGNKKARQKMLLGQKKQLKDFCYRIDGKSSERVVEAVRRYAFR